MAMNILVVDDAVEILELIKKYLSEDGIDTHLAKDAFSAMDILEKQAIDLVILDIGMPYKDGLKFLTELRRTVRYRTLPMMIVSARNQELDIKRAARAGSDDYLVKPFTKEALIQKINRLMKAPAPQTTSGS